MIYRALHTVHQQDHRIVRRAELSGLKPAADGQPVKLGHLHSVTKSPKTELS